MCYTINKAEGIDDRRRDYIITKATESNEHCKETLKKFGVLAISSELIRVFIEKGRVIDRAKYGSHAVCPTGDLHIGGVRTALFNYLFSKQNNGQFILRIEDTDTARNQIEYIDKQYQDLLWLGLKPNESIFQKGEFGPYCQSQRLDIYQKYIQKLVAEKKAYYCFCSKGELEKERAEYLTKNERSNYQYSRKCLKLGEKEVKLLLRNQKEYVIRFRVPQEKNYHLKDLVRGGVMFGGQDIEDFVICRGSGMPLLNLAVVVDDYCMKISHVLRGEEHLPNTAKQLVLYEGEKYHLEPEKKGQVRKIASLFRPHLNYFQELIDLSKYFFQEQESSQIELNLSLPQLEQLKEVKKMLANLKE
ncbi:6820_t:CDS:2 [Funneliformis geosporum]|uniref:6820_t:CDS:1 n=1 Tax=Funneliformis geosporum TaxID=1117311 RepID=A0A9W4WPP7_9GLOM|nr:6820_t:CDS:2 [Funneliformis geosporum]